MFRHPRKKHILFTLIFMCLALLILPIQLKSAVSIEFDDSKTDISSKVGQSVSLLCTPLIEDDSWPSISKYIIVAVENDSGLYELVNRNTVTPMLYVVPAHFVGNAIRSYNYGYNNQFIFRGDLCSGPYIGEYNLQLTSWDIVYPVHHWEFYIGPNNEYYKSHLFIFDYLL